MSDLETNKAKFLESRGKKVPMTLAGVPCELPNKYGGCATPKAVFDGLTYKFVLTGGKPCDSISKWTVDTGSGVVDKEWRWEAQGPTETPWMDGVVISHHWELLGPPSIAAMVWNFGRAVANSFKTGFEKVGDSVMEERLKICRGCDYWDEDVRLGFGKCKHPQCGCTKVKLWLASEECPQGFWNKVID